MAKVRFKGLVEEIQGTLHDVVYKKSPSGKTIVSKKPDMSKVEWNEAQWDHRKRFALASDYAKAARLSQRYGRPTRKGRRGCINVPVTWPTPITF